MSSDGMAVQGCYGGLSASQPAIVGAMPTMQEAVLDSGVMGYRSMSSLSDAFYVNGEISRADRKSYPILKD